MKKIYKILWVFHLVITIPYYAQVGINTTTPDPSAALHISENVPGSTNKKGTLFPRISLLNSTDQTTIASPAAGTIVYNLTDNATDTPQAVTKDTFYFWDGAKWTDMATYETVKNALLPQVFQIIGNQSQNTMQGSPTVQDGLVVNYQGSTIVMNTNNNITLNSNNTFTVNKTGEYEVAGAINYNPAMNGGTASADLEFIIQESSDGTNWTDVAKNTGVWGYGTGANSRTLIISPIVVSLTKGSLIRAMMKNNYGTHGNGASCYPGTGLNYSRLLRLQYLN